MQQLVYDLSHLGTASASQPIDINSNTPNLSLKRTVGNDISKGNVKRSQRSDNVKRSDEGPSVEKKEDGQLSCGENRQLSYADVTRGRK
jgi:hypothetical protein